MKSFIINKNDANQRLDKFVLKLMPNLPKSMLYKGLRKNNVRINGKHCHDGSVILKENDNITLYFNDEFFIQREAQTSDLPMPRIVYEDDNILVIDKPKGLVCHSDEHQSADNLLARVTKYLIDEGKYNQENENTFSPALCNRLDRNTSGLIIAAKNAEAPRIINTKIKSREIEKYYICKCEGKMPKQTDTLEAYLERDDKHVRINDKAIGKRITTKYTVLEETTDSSLLEIKLITGRTHQIRAHLAHIGHPLIGDTKYGGKQNKNGYYLKSYKIKFDFNTSAGPLDYLHNMEITKK